MATPQLDYPDLHELALRRAQALRREAIDDFWREIGVALRRIGSAIVHTSQYGERLQRRPPPPRQ